MGLRIVGNYFWSDCCPPREENENSGMNEQESLFWSTRDVSEALIEKRQDKKFENNIS